MPARQRWRVACGAVAALAVAVAIFTGREGARAQSSQTFTPRDESPEDYPPGHGRDETFYACTACHGFKIVAQQSLTRRQWDDSLNWMTQKHNMPALEGNDRKIVLDYLEATFPPKTQRGWQNPFAK